MELFNSFHSMVPSADLEFSAIAEYIKSEPALKSATNWYREILAINNPNEADKRKKNTPQIAVAFRMDGGEVKVWTTADNVSTTPSLTLMIKMPRPIFPSLNSRRLSTFSVRTTTPFWATRASRVVVTTPSCHTNCQKASTLTW